MFLYLGWSASPFLSILKRLSDFVSLFLALISLKARPKSGGKGTHFPLESTSREIRRVAATFGFRQIHHAKFYASAVETTIFKKPFVTLTHIRMLRGMYGMVSGKTEV